MPSLSERLAETDGRPAGFDYMRVILASMIVVWHTCVTSYGDAAQKALSVSASRPIWAILLPMFFALSGFLVSGSLERSKTLVSFLGLRLIRLIPALAVESLIAMLLIGPIFTTLPLGKYFSNHEFFTYALNIVGDVHVYLPGVFEGNPNLKVNGQLWTLPAELKCYMIISGLFLLGAYRIRTLLLAVCGALQAYVWWKMARDPSANYGSGITPTTIFIFAFVYGVALFRFRDQIPYSKALFGISAILSVVCLNYYSLEAFAPLPVAYTTVYLGLTNPRRHAAVSSGDYSYGIFLYGFPIQQAIMAALPGERIWWVNLLIALPIVYVVAYLSWHLVEKRALKLRPALKRLEQAWLPANDFIARTRNRMVPGGLRVRWAPRQA